MVITCAAVKESTWTVHVTPPKLRNSEYQILNLWSNILTVQKKAGKIYYSLRLPLNFFFKYK